MAKELGSGAEQLYICDFKKIRAMFENTNSLLNMTLIYRIPDCNNCNILYV